MALTAEEKIEHGLSYIRSTSKGDKRWAYYKGENDLPYAPKGVNHEYMELRQQAATPLIRLSINVPVQRLKIGGIRPDYNSPSDDNTWQLWLDNRLSTKSRTLYTHALALGHGVMSIWPGDDGPRINLENPTNLHIQKQYGDPDTIDYVVKSWTHIESIHGNNGMDIVMLYTDSTIYRYTIGHNSSTLNLEESYDNPMGRVPFVLFAAERDADGTCNSMIDPLMPMQRAIDTMQFNLLLAAQFAAFRQRVVVGYDPVVRDTDGNMVYRTDADGNPMTDADGNPIPLINKPGQAGVDRLLVFPGAGTKVFDLEESDLTNYVASLHHLIATFAAAAQVPAQYLVGDFKNVSGDLMTATEATLRSHVAELQATFGDSWKEVFELASLAQGQIYSNNVMWMDAEPKDIAQIADAASKLVPQGAPLGIFLRMLPGMDQHEVQNALKEGREQLNRALANDLAAEFGPVE